MRSVIWMSNNMLEQILDDNGEYVLRKAGTSQETSLGETVAQAKDKLRKLGRTDIVSQL